MRFDAVIFDMDGLLLDTEKIALETFVATCQVLNIPMQRSVYNQCIGTNAEKTREILLSGFGEEFPYERMAELWNIKYREEALEKPVPLKQGVIGLLTRIAELELPMAIATSTAQDKARLKLRNAGILTFFELIVSGDQVQHSKPDPEIYLKAAGLLGKKPQRCLALEDSDNGVKSAHQAGMFVIQIPDLLQPSSETRQLGHKILDSLFDVARLLSPRELN
jgi:HAD superfamily hydrolase (TIGR01509 family)